MCGLAGVFAPHSDTCGDLTEIAGRMALQLRHRGPDDAGVWADPQGGIAFGHRRLSILDLSAAGHQPMHSGNRRFVLAFNGEIYNHLEIRKELNQSGKPIKWRGHSDTETLLNAFDRWGIEATLRRAVGMFALALWDCKEGNLTLARDRMGEKPLYYGWTGHGRDRSFVFGSELKALRAHPGFNNPISRDALALYFQFNNVPAPHSIYENIFKLPPSSFFTLNARNYTPDAIVINRYWRLEEVARKGLCNPISSETEVIRLLTETLREALSLQAIADVPLGAFLSGGVDSSTIVAIMQEVSATAVKTFTVGFDESGFDESVSARAVARHLRTDHHEIRVRPLDALAVVPELPTLYDEPFADSSQIPTYLVCRAARQYVTVALSGDGGDELFGGYNRYIWAARILRDLERFPPMLVRGTLYGIQRVPASILDALGTMLPSGRKVLRLSEKAHRLAHRLHGVNGPDDLYKNVVTEWAESEALVKRSKMLSTRLDERALVDAVGQPEQRMMLWDGLTYLPDDILTKVDRAAMGIGLETRVPFLDHRVVELAWRFPLNMKVRNGQGKWALRRVLEQYVPSHLIERPKTGFSIPVAQWLRGPLRDWAEALLSEQRLSEEGYLETKLIRRVWRQHLSGRFDWSARLWSVLMFQAWLTAES